MGGTPAWLPMQFIIVLLIIVHTAGNVPVHRESSCVPLAPAVYSIFPDGSSVLSAASPLSCPCPTSSHDGMLSDGIARLGK